MKGKGMDTGEILAAFSSHISENYPSPEGFKRDLDRILECKLGREGEGGYGVSLEKNVIFLHDMIVEGEALLDVLLRPSSGPDAGGSELDRLLEEMEAKVRRRTVDRHREIFSEGKDREFDNLRDLKESDEAAFLEKLEFNYRYLMTLKILLFNFLASIEEEDLVSWKGSVTSRQVMDHLEFSAHYYLGNIKVGEGTEVERR
jgi:hypothetical protein